MSENRPVHVIPTETYFSRVRQALSENGRAYVRVTGISMMPLLRHLKDGVILVPPKNIRRGDIVLFDRRNGRYALHRVIRKEKTGFTMAGDNQWHMEKDLPYDQVVGVASDIVRGDRAIPCNIFFLRVYSFVVTELTFPRIYIWKAVGRLRKLWHHSEIRNREGA